MELSATGRVILGMLAVEPQSGYDIKTKTDASTRFFWAASYGQIYPELGRLAERGLVEGSEHPQGERRRRVYSITAAGREALTGWLAGSGQTHELRDEGLLKLFFAGVAGRDELVAAVEGKRALHVATLERLREIEPKAAATERFGPHAVLCYGLELHEFAIRWCDATLEQLAKWS